MILNTLNISAGGLMDLIARGHLFVELVFKSKNDQERIQKMLTNYHNVPASFADACLVCMAENTSEIMTLDSDFTIYRKTTGEPLNLISPF